MLLSYIKYLDTVNPRLADAEDRNLRLAAGGYTELKDDIKDICIFLYSNLYKTFIDLTYSIRSLSPADRQRQEPKLMNAMRSKFINIGDEATSMLQAKYPNYQVPRFIEDFAAGVFESFGTPELDAWYSHEYNQHVLVFRFFNKNELLNGSLVPVSSNEFFGYVEHEINHYIQLKDYVWKTDDTGELILSKEEFDKKNNSLTEKHKSEAKHFKIEDPKEVARLYSRVLGDQISGFELQDIEAAAKDIIESDNQILWDRNNPTEVSAHIQNIMRQLPSPKPKDVSNTKSFFAYVGKSNDFIEYISFVKNPVVKNKFLKALYVAITTNMNNPDKFDITNIEDTLFADVEDYRANKESELMRSPAEKLKTMQPMKKRRK